jgi:hypothetical protein
VMAVSWLAEKVVLPDPCCHLKLCTSTSQGPSAICHLDFLVCIVDVTNTFSPYLSTFP